MNDLESVDVVQVVHDWDIANDRLAHRGLSVDL